MSAASRPVDSSTISATISSSPSSTLSAGYDESKEDKDAEDRYVYRERRCGSVSRSFNVEGIREEDITARFQDGVLTLELPKREAPAVPEARHIEIQ